MENRADVETATTAMEGKWNASGSVSNMGDHLEAEEQVLRMAVGRREHDKTKGVLVLTDRRLLFVKKGVLRKSNESIPLDLITAVAMTAGVLGASIKTTGAQSMETIQGVNKADAAALVTDLRQLINSRSQSAMTSVAPSDLGDQLAKLAALRDQGVLSEPEFQTQKTRLLSA